jgi:SAM-dependent methyltransferase
MWSEPLLWILKAPLNHLSFWLRQRLHWQRGLPPLPDEPKEGLFADFPARERQAAELLEQNLRHHFALENLYQHSSQHDYRDNLYLIEALRQLCADVVLPEQLHALDVGCKNFHYAPGLYQFLCHWQGPRQVELTGIELDGYGIYADGFSRADYGHAWAQQADPTHVHFRVADVLALKGSSFELITCFYPFMTAAALLNWGLPLRCFQPQALLAHCWELLTPGGRLILFHQTAQEANIAQQYLGTETLCRALPLDLNLVTYYPQTRDRHMRLWQKPTKK